ncbi:hypothetical protein [Desulfoluna sp.]|uniref:hypothetical protein n=1 Tax=Desulfoluna sp. TaxID=2045199 RepID=UPI002622D856|nr:hypothetical protein [Desulfoluna sp.]
MRRLIIILLVFMMMTPTGAMAYDIDVFDECSVAIKPNVLFLMDTSLSMRRQDVLPDGIESYDSEGAFIIKRDSSGALEGSSGNWNIRRDEDNNDSNPDSSNKQSYRDRGFEGNDYGVSGYRKHKYEDNIFYWLVINKTTGAGDWHPFHPGNWLQIYEVKNEDVVESFLKFGMFQGDLDKHGEIENTDEQNLYATGDYINYLRYMENAQKSLNWNEIDSSEPYDSKEEYRRFHNDSSTEVEDLGYGDYITNKVYVRMAGDIRPFNSIRNFLDANIPNGIYISDPGGKGRQIINCEDARKNLIKDGWTRSKVWEAFGCSCGGTITYTLMVGNFLNYLDKVKSRRYNAIDALWSVVSKRTNDARYGIMQFDLGIFSTFFDLSHWTSQGADLAAPCGSSQDTIKRILFGKYDHDQRTKSTYKEFGQPLYFGHPADISKETPLAESLIEAGCYFAGAKSWFNTAPFSTGFFDTTHSGGGSVTDSVYKSPIQCRDQKNHIIIITDGAPKDDFEVFDGLFTNKGRGVSWKWILNKPFYHFDPDDNTAVSDKPIGNCFVPTPPLVDNDVKMVFETKLNVNYKQQWLDDVSYFLFQKDMTNKQNDKGRQNIHTHTLGLELAVNAGSIDRPLLTQAAENGHGHYMFTSSKEKLIAELNSILNSAMEDFSFSSAASPVSQSDMIYTDSDLYMSSFLYEAGTRGRGNITKYKRVGDEVKGGEVNGNEAHNLFDMDGKVDSSTRDCWYPGGDPTYNTTDNPKDNPKAKDGLARKLYDQINTGLSFGNNPTPREILNTVKVKRDILFLNGGSLGDIADLAVAGTIEIPKEGGGYYGDTVNAQTVGELDLFLTRKIYGLGYNWPLGDIIHSNVAIARYPDSTDHVHDVTDYLFVGTNGGMLHCFKASSGIDSGKEEWAIVYPDFKDRLHELESFFDDEEHWFADGHITLYYEHEDHTTTIETESVDYKVKNPKYLIAGERRGGKTYHIIDVSTVGTPSYVASVGNDSDGYSWGQSWSKPQLCQVKDSNNLIEQGFLVAGGYDTNQDNDFLSTDDNEGRFVAIYGFDGNPLHTLGLNADGTSSLVEACIVDARIIDHDHKGGKNRIFSHVYAGDLKGNVYRWEDAGENGTWNSGHKLFSGDSSNSDDPPFAVTIEGDSRNLYQKIFYAPVAGMACNEDRVFFGTGDREHPLGDVKDPVANDYSNFKDSVYCVPDNGLKTYTRSDLSKITLDPSSITEKDKDGNSLPADGSVPGGVVQEIYGNIGIAEADNTTSCKTDCETGYDGCVDKCNSGDDPCELTCGVDLEQCKLHCGRGWYFDFIRDGEKVISAPLVMDNILIFGTYTPPTVTITSDPCNAGGTCVPGRGRVYVVSSCEEAFAVKSYKLVNNPMPQPSLVFDADSGKVLISTGDGTIIDPKLPVIVPDYWKHSGSAL